MTQVPFVQSTAGEPLIAGEKEIEFFEDADGAGVILRGRARNFFTESAARQGVTVEHLLSGLVREALEKGQF